MNMLDVELFNKGIKFLMINNFFKLTLVGSIAGNYIKMIIKIILKTPHYVDRGLPEL